MLAGKDGAGMEEPLKVKAASGGDGDTEKAGIIAGNTMNGVLKWSCGAVAENEGTKMVMGARRWR